MLKKVEKSFKKVLTYYFKWCIISKLSLIQTTTSGHNYGSTAYELDEFQMTTKNKLKKLLTK